MGSSKYACRNTLDAFHPQLLPEEMKKTTAADVKKVQKLSNSNIDTGSRGGRTGGAGCAIAPPIFLEIDKI